jgi:hypothetical protein
MQKNKKTRQLNFNNIEVDFKQDYLNLNKTVAISAEGYIFKIGDIVGHDGSTDKSETATIFKFSVNLDSFDVIAHTERGFTTMKTNLEDKNIELGEKAAQIEDAMTALKKASDIISTEALSNDNVIKQINKITGE